MCPSRDPALPQSPRPTTTTTPASITIRPPIVTIMGHVDHGKTTLLDALRRASVAATEAGGITQHLGAFQVILPDSRRRITFLDTPGHAAFHALRARGARVTDIVILVVAADDGVMPQTRESLQLVRAAQCGLVVALTKVDKVGREGGGGESGAVRDKNAAIERVKRQLASEGVELEEEGGTVQVVEVAALKGIGLRELEEAVVLQAELMGLRAELAPLADEVVDASSPPSSTSASSSSIRPPLRAWTVEARMDTGRGPVAVIVLRQGELRIGDCMVIGSEYGRIRSMHLPGGMISPTASAAAIAQHNKASSSSTLEGNAEATTLTGSLRVARPGEAVEVTGLRGLPAAGDEVMLCRSEEHARRLADARKRREREARLVVLAAAGGDAKDASDASRTNAADTASSSPWLVGTTKRKRRERLAQQAEEFEAKKKGEIADESSFSKKTGEALTLVLKADVQGSLDAISASVLALTADQVPIRILHAALGPVTDADVELAAAARATILAFNTKSYSNDLAERRHVRIVQDAVIYRLLENVDALQRERVPKMRVPEVGGVADVLRLFPIKATKGEAASGPSVVAGCKVVSGVLTTRNVASYKLLRSGEVVWEGKLKTLRHLLNEVREVKQGTECGVLLDGCSKIELGDRIECVVLVEQPVPLTRSGVDKDKETGRGAGRVSRQ